MCGIAGILALDGRPLPDAAAHTVHGMTEAMKWRGPDGEGLWKQGPVCFGHRRLSIIDLAGGNQPMSYADGQYTIVFNGEIYNFLELREDLSKKGALFKTNSDTEVLLAAYASHGAECLEMLEGMFAFALWDKKEETLFCARDHFGKKPFYYTLQNGHFAFASELGSLALLKNAPWSKFSFTVDPSALARYLAYEYVPTPQSIYREVQILEPSHYLWIKKEKLAVTRYWDLPFPEKNLPASEEELCQELRALMTRAARLRMISDVPLGVFLSGGIDSTIIAGLMAQLSDAPIKTFSIGFREASYDESSYAEIAAKAYGSEHHCRILSAEDCALELPALARRMDTPMADASCAPTWLLSALARENVAVALGGDGSDELWAGYEHYIGYRIALVYNKLPAWLRKGIEGVSNFLPQSANYINLRLAVQTFLKGAASPDWLRVQTMLTAIAPDLQRQIFSGEWLANCPGDMLDEKVLFASTARQFWHWREKSATSLERAFHVYARQFMLDDILVKVDRCSMLHSLEVRAPFLDKKVAEFVGRLPMSCKLHGFRRKYLLKRAFAKLLPPEILKRNKRGFQIPVAAWLRGKLKPLLLDLLSAENLRQQGIFNPGPIEKMMLEHFAEKRDYRKELWTLLVLQLWLDANRPDF